jgi:hypothetical protein
MAGQIPIKFTPAAVDSASCELTESAVSNDAVERIAPEDETDANAKSQSSGADAAEHVVISPESVSYAISLQSVMLVVPVCFLVCCMLFLFFGAAGFNVFLETTRSEGRASTPDPLKGLTEFTYFWREVLVLPDSNKDCSKKPDVDSLEFCVVMQGCPDTPETPGGRCGFEPGVYGREGSVFRDGVENVLDRTGICQREDNRKRIIAAAGVYSRSITTYSVTCVGPECNFWKTKTTQFNESCGLDIFMNSTDTTPILTCLYLESRPTAWSKAQDGLSTCQIFWPTLKEVIRQKIPSNSSITDKYSQYLGGTFAITGPKKNDRDAWFNICGFCSYIREAQLYAPCSRSRHTPRRLHCIRPNASSCLQLTRFNSVLGAILVFGGIPLLFDFLAMTGIMVISVWNRCTKKDDQDHDLMFRHCYFYRQFWDLVCSKGHLRNFFLKLFRCNPYMGNCFACCFQYSVSNFIQLGFALLSALFGGERDSLLTETSEITSFEVSMASSVVSIMNTFIFYVMFRKWGDRIKIIKDAKYSCAIFLLQLVDFALSVVAIILAIKILVESHAVWWLYIFPIFKILLTIGTCISLYEHRPCRQGDDMLHFAACDSKACVRETKQPHPAVENGVALNTLVVV